MAAIGNAFGQTLRSEWTKLRSVRGIAWLLVALTLAVALSLLGGAQTSTSTTGPRHVDEFTFVHRSLVGDGTVVARVLTQQHSHEFAKAGVMVKQGAHSGATYAALMVTPGHGVRLQADFTIDQRGSANAAPRWLRLTRSGPSVTGHESADGVAWIEVGSVRLATLATAVEVGLFVTSPPNIITTREGTNTSSEPVRTLGAATFDNVAVSSAAQEPTDWRTDHIGATDNVGAAGTTGASEVGGVFTVTGSGDVAGVRSEGNDDVVRISLSGLQLAVLAMVVFGVVFMTSEYRQGLIRSTFAATPQRGRVLWTKAMVIGASAFATGLAVSVAAVAFTQPILRRNGYVPPAYPYISLFDPPVRQAVVGSALYLTALALMGLGIGTLVRNSAGAIVAAIGLVAVPQIATGPLSEELRTWIYRLTPTAGLAIQQTRGHHLIDPWLGVGVAFGYAAIALVLGHVLLRSRDV